MIQPALPKPSGDFEWVQESWGAALRCQPLAAFAPHLFSTQSLRLTASPDDHPLSWAALATALGVSGADVVRMRQVHCADVFDASRGFSEAAWPEADIAISDEPDVAVSVRAADCVPILLGDVHTRAVAAIHAGWKGTAAGAAMTAVRAMTARYASNPSHLVAAVGPCIGPCCYEVGRDVADAFLPHPEARSWFTENGPLHLDLWRATRDQLVRAGVRPDRIHVAALCTFDHPQVFPSYRRDGAQAGRLVAAIRSGRDTTL
jgi:YfiH family protein